PLLFTAGTAVDPLVLAELDRVLGGAGTVYLLGGEAALGPAVADELTEAGYTVRRLAGPSRLETAVAIAERVVALTGGGTVALARAFAPADQPTAAWVDSVTAGAWAADSGNPILVVDGQAETLPGSVAAFLDRLDPAHVVALGGTAAVSDAVVTATGA